MAGEETEEGEEIGAERQTMETMETCKQVDAEDVLEEKKNRRGESFGLKRRRRRRWRKMLSPKKRMKAMRDLTTEKESFGKRIVTGSQMTKNPCKFLLKTSQELRMLSRSLSDCQSTI